MRTRVRLLSLALMAVALLAFAACGDDDSNADQQSAEATAASGQTGGTQSGGSGSSSSTTTRAIELNCDQDLKSFRFAGDLSLNTPQGGSSAPNNIASVIGSFLQNVKFDGAFVTPDRTQLKLDGGQSSPLGAIEFIQIGNTSYVKLGSAPWQQSQGATDSSGFLAQIDPREICHQFEENLTDSVPAQKEAVNSVDATRYDYDRAALEKLGASAGGLLGTVGGSNGELPENATLSVWVSDKEKFPVKMQIAASGEQDGEDYSLNMALNVTDLNGNVTINAPQ
ncbi:MAG: hypothetical protein AB7R89_21160 [Dehalococcoidia bacterium]